MSILFTDDAIGLGLASLLQDLNGVQASLEALDSTYPDPESTKLLERVKDLVDINRLLNNFILRERRQPSMVPDSIDPSDLVLLQSILDATTTIVGECATFATAVQASLNDLKDERQVSGCLTDESMLQNQPWYDETCQALKLRAEILQALSSAIEVLRHRRNVDGEGNLVTEARSMASTLHYQIALIEPKLITSDRQITQAIRNAVAAAKSITFLIPSSNINKHFLAARSVKSYYTGRAKQMAGLKAAFEDPSSGQKRFVIYGLAGSGKTELALKYAEDHQSQFWGVFFIDGSSRQNASASYLEIATVGGVEPNERAAKNWLLTRELTWLLIVDSVDDEEVQIDDLLPTGNRGSIIITSRNPGLRTHGNTGKRYIELQIMEKEEANDLILKAAEEPTPQPLTVKEAATTICHALGYLPLALVHAAKAILLGLCSWQGYLTYYERQTHYIQRQRQRQRSRSKSGTRKGPEEVTDNMNVFSSYEVLYQSLEASQDRRCEDAVDLLHVFSYFHFQNIRLETFVCAATNPLKEAAQQKIDAEEELALQVKRAKLRPKSWSQWFRELIFMLRKYSDSPAPLPTVLKNPDGLSANILEDEVHIRLGEALAVLKSRSLIMTQDRVEGLYSMHPLVHKWVRERPSTAVALQALWCQTAMTTLAKSILRPPLGDTRQERSLRRELLPHIVHAERCQEVLKERLEENKVFSKPYWSVPGGSFHALHADQSARFSRVYSECGLFTEALQLQKQTLSFLVCELGDRHPVTIRVNLFVSGTLWELARPAEATQIQRRALQNSVDALGEEHPLTLQVADLLGSALYLKGRWAEALRILEDNLVKVTRVFGEDHEKTFKSIRNVARLYYRYMNYLKATALFEKSWIGMRSRLGEKHFDTLECLQDLAMSYMRHEADPDELASRDELLLSQKRMEFILQEHRETLGQEQPYTLLAVFFLAQLKSALGEVDVAERMIEEGLPVAQRNFGEHPAVMMARAFQARLFIQMGRLQEAEAILRALTRKSLYREMSDEDGDHPDRISSIWFLSGCLEKQGRLEQALEAAEETYSCMCKVGGQGLGAKHKFAAKVCRRIAALRERLEGDGQKVANGCPSPLAAELVEPLRRVSRSVTA